MTASHPPPRSRSARLAWIAGLGVLPFLLGPSCQKGGELVTVTLNAVPPAHNEILVVPPSGFTVDVTFPKPASVDAGTVEIRLNGLDGSVTDVTDDLVVAEPDRAVARVPASADLAPGSYWVEVQVETSAGEVAGAAHPFAVRSHPENGPPLGSTQWVQLDFVAAFRDDLAAFGLLPTGDPTLELTMLLWALQEVVDRTGEFYGSPNPSGLPGGDAADVVFSVNTPPSGPYTRVCVGGPDPTGGSVVGKVLFDPLNQDPAQVACDDFLPSGIFPRELLAFSGQGAFQGAFAAVLATPVGSHPLDATVLGPSYDPGDPVQLARHQEIETAVTALAQAVATVTAHEVAHALGLVPRGEPGGGLFGGSSGPQDTHNVEPGGGSPQQAWLMNEGASFGFAELAGWDATPLPRFRELNWAYLRGRIVLDAAVTGIFPPPVIDYANLSQVSLSGPPVVPYTCWGEGFLPTPQIRLRGPFSVSLVGENWESENQVSATLPVLQLTPGLWDVELTNPDGQVAVLEDAVEVLP